MTPPKGVWVGELPWVGLLENQLMPLPYRGGGAQGPYLPRKDALGTISGTISEPALGPSEAFANRYSAPERVASSLESNQT